MSSPAGEFFLRVLGGHFDSLGGHFNSLGVILLLWGVILTVLPQLSAMGVSFATGRLAL